MVQFGKISILREYVWGLNLQKVVINSRKSLGMSSTGSGLSLRSRATPAKKKKQKHRDFDCAFYDFSRMRKRFFIPDGTFVLSCQKYV